MLHLRGTFLQSVLLLTTLFVGLVSTQSGCNLSSDAEFDCATDPASIGLCVDLHPEVSGHLIDWACISSSCEDGSVKPEFDDGCSSLVYLQARDVHEDHACVTAWAELPREDQLNLGLLGLEGGQLTTVPPGELLPDSTLAWNVTVVGPSQLQLGQFFQLHVFTDHRPATGRIRMLVRFAGDTNAVLVERDVAVSAAGASGAFTAQVPGRIAYDRSLVGGPHIVEVALADESGRIGAVAYWQVVIVDGQLLVCPDQASCGAMVCGREPVCGVPCGVCSPGQACSIHGTCEVVHPHACPAAAQCGVRVCGIDPICGVPCGVGCPGGQLCTVDGRCELDPSMGSSTDAMMGSTGVGSTSGGESSDVGSGSTGGEDDSGGTDGIDCVSECAVAGSSECVDGQVRECEVGLEGCLNWGEFVACETGACRDAEFCDECQHACELGESRCVDAGRMSPCEVDMRGCRNFGEPVACEGGSICKNGRCSSPDCTDECPWEGATACDDDGKEVPCVADADEDDCLEWANDGRECPSGQLCVEENCEDVCADECEDGASQCVGEQVRHCIRDANGCWMWGTAEECGTGQVCVRDVCAVTCDHACESIGASSCEGELIRVCESNAMGCRVWGSAVPCKDGATCKEDSCVNPSIVRAIEVRVYSSKSCARTRLGALYCWGHDYNESLGDGIVHGGSPWNEEHEPNLVVGLDSGVTSFAPGHAHSCAVQRGVTKCWGANDWVGTGPVGFTVAIPVVVPSLPADGIEVTVSGDNTCVLGASNWLKCWGYNKHGEVGNASLARPGRPARTPVDVDFDASLTASKLVSTSGTRAFCAIFSGEMSCWGGGDSGLLGNGTEFPQSWQERPEPVVNLASPVEEAGMGGSNACAKVGEKFFCWGRNLHGNMGTGALEPDFFASAHEMDFPGGLTPTIISIGYNFMCAIADDGRVYCWGENREGQLGTGSDEVMLTTPHPTESLVANAVSLSAGFTHACAVLENGGVTCWGNNKRGQLGTGTHTAWDRSYLPGKVHLFGDWW